MIIIKRGDGTLELVPHSEAQVSGDKEAWLCRRPNKTVRCFFFKPGGV